MHLTVDVNAQLVRRVLKSLGDPPLEVVLWDGTSLQCRSRPIARVHLADRATLWRALLRGERGLGDAYCQGKIEIEGDLPAFVACIFRCDPVRPPGLMWKLRQNTPALRRPKLERLRSLGRSRRNAQHHYDVGNDFYALWLDSEMNYTCAYYPQPNASLAEAQRAKLDYVARKLCLRPGESVVEAGGGWGALAMHMARHYGVHVRSYNISREQVAFARARARREALDDRVEFIEDDYRNIRGRYDAFVSVGMLEHVGRAHHATLGRVIDACLSSHGRGLLHSIGRMRPARMDDWIATRIFPGSYIPALGEMVGVLAPHPFDVLDVENLRPHYAKTLEQWLERFDKNVVEARSEVRESLIRAWRLYLAASVASFRTGNCQLFQILFARPECRSIPSVRAHLYRPRHDGNAGQPELSHATV